MNRGPAITQNPHFSIVTTVTILGPIYYVWSYLLRSYLLWSYLLLITLLIIIYYGHPQIADKGRCLLLTWCCGCPSRCHLPLCRSCFYCSQKRWCCLHARAHARCVRCAGSTAEATRSTDDADGAAPPTNRPLEGAIKHHHHTRFFDSARFPRGPKSRRCPGADSSSRP